MIAHLVQTGLGAYYDGVMHVLVTVEDAALVLGLALAAGSHGKPEARALIMTLPAAWVLGGLTSALTVAGPPPVWSTTLSIGIVGALVAVRARIPRAGLVALAATLGVLHGFANGAELDTELAKGLLGIGQSVFVLATLAAAWAATLRAEWALVAVRVAGSWILAIGLLMCGWALRG